MFPIKSHQGRFLCLKKIINLRLRVDDFYYVCQSLYHNLAIVVDFVCFSSALSRRQVQRGAASNLH